MEVVVGHQRQAYALLGRLRGREPHLRGHVIAQLAQVRRGGGDGCVGVEMVLCGGDNSVWCVW